VADTGSFRNVAPSSITELPTVTIQLSQYVQHVNCTLRQFSPHHNVLFYFNIFDTLIYLSTRWHS
jgi:hypothetical protein